MRTASGATWLFWTNVIFGLLNAATAVKTFEEAEPVAFGIASAIALACFYFAWRVSSDFHRVRRGSQ